MLRSLRNRRCGKAKGLLSEYIDGALGASDHRMVEEHVGACNECATELQSLQKAVEAIRCVPVVEVPRPFAISGVEVKRTRAHEPERLRWLRPATALAVVVLMVLVSADFLVLNVSEVEEEPLPRALSAPAPDQESLKDGFQVSGENEVIGMFGSEVSPAGGEPGEGGELEGMLMTESQEGGWPVMRWVEVSLGVVVFTLLTATLYKSLRRRAWKGT